MTHDRRWKSSARVNAFTLAVGGLALQLCAVGALSAAEPKMPSFAQFYKSVGGARFEDFAKREGVKVSNAGEFGRMKAHVLSTYEGVKVRNSFAMGEREFIDCVDVRTQPGLRQGGKFVPPEKPPAAMIAQEKPGDEARKGRPVEPMLSATKKDAFGNAQYCSEGFIPMRRITLDELTRYETLGDFFNKYGKSGEKGLPVGK